MRNVICSRECAVVVLSLSLLSSRSEQVIISEIQYHPPDARPEWVELVNLTATPFDIALWKVRGGVDYDFPDFSAADPKRTFLGAYERILISSADPQTTRAAYGIAGTVRIYGPWSGRLDDDSDRVTVRDKNGLTICTVGYEDDGHWPPAADGAGHTLVLQNPTRSIDDWRNWAASLRPGGTPGTEPIKSSETRVANPEVSSAQGLPVIEYGDRWKYHDLGMDLGTEWRTATYDDRSWPDGGGLLGFEDSALPPPGIRTPLRNAGLLTFYLRKTFVYSGRTAGASLVLDQIVDDGAVYYLNGQELARPGMGGGTVTFSTTANRTVGNAVEELTVYAGSSTALVTGTNVLAVELHQTGAGSSDVVFGARLRIAQPMDSPVLISEVRPGAAGQGFIEFFNPQSAAVNLRGHYLSDSAAVPSRFRINTDLVVPPQGYQSVGFAEMGFAQSRTIVVLLFDADGATLLTGINADIPLDGRSLGQHPPGSGEWFLYSDPTRNEANVNPASLDGILRLNEVHFSSSNTVDWVELANVGSNALSGDGLFLATRRDLSDRVPLSGSMEGKGIKAWATEFPLNQGEVTLFLVQGADRVLDSRRLERRLNAGSMQAFPDGTAEWYVSDTASRDQGNDPARQTEIVINEVMFDPPSDQRDREFIEVYNRGATPVDLSGWKLEEGVNFTFPAGTMLGAGSYLVVAADGERLREIYGNIAVAGNFSGRLSNTGELIRLLDQRGNLADEVDYRVGGDWPRLTKGNGASMELVNPQMDNSRSSAWRDSDENAKSNWNTYTFTDTYLQVNSFGVTTDFKEFHFHLAGDGQVAVRNISLRKDRTGPNLITNGTAQSQDGTGATGWLCQGTHAGSFMAGNELRIVSDGHGDNRANRVEIDIPGIVSRDVCQLTLEARWISGTPRLIAQTWDHSLGTSFRLDVPENLGSPGLVNSRYAASPSAQIDELQHSPPVPRSTQDVVVTARVYGAGGLAAVELWHRPDNANSDAVWQKKPMFDDGVSGGDAAAEDGLYTATLTEYKRAGAIVQFYAQAQSAGSGSVTAPRDGAERPALYIVDDRGIQNDLRISRFIVSEYDLGAINNGNTAKYRYRFPRLSNHYVNSTYIANEKEIFYNTEVRNSGSPWTRAGDLSRGKFKVPADRLFRGREKFSYDNDPTAGRMHHNRIARYWLYLLGEPSSENEFVRVIVNAGGASLREDTETVANEFLDRAFENGSAGELYRIDDEWWFTDAWDRRNRNADWLYKNSENPVRYHSEWMKRTREDDYDYSSLINFFKTVSNASFTQQQIERLVDAESIMKTAAVRGYIQDWDSFTLDRGKNGYFYRRYSDGVWQFLHWDSDLTFGNAGGALYNGVPGVRAFIERPYNIRRFYHYLSEMLRLYTKDSPRMEAWLAAEEEASPSYAIAADRYRTWFNDRLPTCLAAMGANYTRALAVTSNGGRPITTNSASVTITGTAPYTVQRVEILGHPELRPYWTNQLTWVLADIPLREGDNELTLIGVDQWGNVLQQASLTVTKTGNSAPRMEVDADPGSWHVLTGATLSLDARDSWDPEGTPLVFEWSVDRPDLARMQTNEYGQATIVFTRPGLFATTVRASDTAGQAGTFTHEIAVASPGGFSAFAEPKLEAAWSLGNVEYRGNYSPDSWISLLEFPGQLTLQCSESRARPFSATAEVFPFVWRFLPASSPWVFQTKVKLTARQFGEFQSGLFVDVNDGAGESRFSLGFDGGEIIRVKRHGAGGSVETLGSAAMFLAETELRARRTEQELIFEVGNDDRWVVLHRRGFAGGTARRAALYVSTTQPQAVQSSFEYAMLIDPEDSSVLRENLRLSEIMYNPVGGDAYEFVELANVGATTLELGGAQFITGIDYTFPAVTLGAGQRLAVASDVAAFRARYGTDVPVVGPFTGRLDNGGETLTVVDAQGQVVLSVAYDDSGSWPARADGFGSSLEAVDLRGNFEDPANWNSSAEFNGSPGAAGTGPVISVVINEVLTHTDPPLEDAIELFNTTGHSIDISGWFLSDGLSDVKKFRVPANTILAAGGYRVFYEEEFRTNNPATPFALDSAFGDHLWLVSATASGDPIRFENDVAFGSSANGVSFGRFPNGTGPLVPMKQLTLGTDVRPDDPPERNATFKTGQGAPNDVPRVGPIVMDQILYHPAEGQDEFIRIQNAGLAAGPLYDPLHVTNTWRLTNGVEFVFPTGISLDPGAVLYVVGIDAAVFRSKNTIDPAIRILGPFSGGLDNGGERLELVRPDLPQTVGVEAGYVPYLLVDWVRYDDETPWPMAPDGLGPYLERVDRQFYGDTPDNWRSSDDPVDSDRDQDGMPDAWEIQYAFEMNFAGDAVLDADLDGLSNLEEFWAGTDPRAAGSTLAVAVRIENGSVVLVFRTAPGKSYSVIESRDATPGSWRAVATIPAQDEPGVQTIPGPPANASGGFYQVVTPALP